METNSRQKSTMKFMTERNKKKTCTFMLATLRQILSFLFLSKFRESIDLKYRVLITTKLFKIEYSKLDNNNSYNKDANL